MTQYLEDFIESRYSMVSGQGIAVSHIYRKVTDNNGHVWLYAIDSDEPGSLVYYHNPKDTQSQGFGGATLEFPLEDGTSYSAKGAWHGNSDALYAATGVDLRSKHKTFVVLFRRRELADNRYIRYVMRDVVYRDPDGGIVGDFDRWKTLAAQYPTALFFYSQSAGGSSCGLIPGRVLDTTQEVTS